MCVPSSAVVRELSVRRQLCGRRLQGEGDRERGGDGHRPMRAHTPTLHIINQCGGDGLFDTGCAVEVASAGRMGDQQPRRDETRLDPIFDVFTVADDEA